MNIDPKFLLIPVWGILAAIYLTLTLARRPGRVVISLLVILLLVLLAGLTQVFGPGQAAAAVSFATVAVLTSPLVLILLLVAAVTARNHR